MTEKLTTPLLKFVILLLISFRMEKVYIAGNLQPGLGIPVNLIKILEKTSTSHRRQRSKSKVKVRN